MTALTEAAIDRALAQSAPGLAKYLWLQANLRERDIRTDTEFQRRFKGFYKVRRNEEWQRVYFDLMESAKPHGMDFGDALAALRQATGRLEASFGSKLVASYRPALPVIDRFVLQNFGLRLPYEHAVNRERTIVDVMTN